MIMNSYNLRVNSDDTINLEYVSGLINIGLKEPDHAPNYHNVKFKLIFSGDEGAIVTDVEKLDLDTYVYSAFNNAILIHAGDETIQGIRTIPAERRSLSYVGKLLIRMLQALLDSYENGTTVSSVTFVK